VRLVCSLAQWCQQGDSPDHIGMCGRITDIRWSFPLLSLALIVIFMLLIDLCFQRMFRTLVSRCWLLTAQSGANTRTLKRLRLSDGGAQGERRAHIRDERNTPVMRAYLIDELGAC